MRVLHVIPGLAPRSGGPSVAVAALCRELARRDIEVAIYTTNFDGDGELAVDLFEPVVRDGVIYRYFPLQKPRFYLVSVPLARALKADIPTYDIVHIHSLYLFPPTIAAYYCRLYGVPYIVRPHGSLDPAVYFHHRWRKTLYEHLIEWRNLEGAASVHFTSESEQAQVARLGLRIRGVVAGLGVDLPAPDGGGRAGAFRHAHPELADKFLVLFLGRLNFKKGLDILVRAFAILKRDHPNARLVLAGPDDEGYGEKVRRWAQENDVLDSVTFTGLVVGREKSALLADADVFVLPSYGENFGISVVEAMAHGLPVVISSRVGICAEIATSGAGIVVSCDVGEVVDAIRAIIDGPKLAKEMGERGRRAAAERFSWSAAGCRMVHVYERIVAGNYLEM